MNLIIFFIFVAIGIYVFLRFTKKGKQLHIFQSPRELLLTTHEEINEELNLFISKHDFSIYTPNVGVFGENSTGKSTFLNAMLGNKDEFKMGFGETTDKITILYKNEKPLPEGKSNFSQLYSNRNYKKMNYKHLDYMNLFDIPGFGQQFSHDILSEVIQEMDIVFWFIDASTGVKKDDKLFLENIKGSDTKVIIILNKIDRISENDEIDNLIKEINREISKIRTFFKEEEVLNNLVTVFPFSAIKSLVGTVKGEKGASKVIDKIVENVLLYTVFIESYRGYINYVLDDEIELSEMKELMINIVSDTSYELEVELKDNISFRSSLNPLSSKNEEAEPIVLEYISLLEKRLENLNLEFVSVINTEMEDIRNELSSFEAFAKRKKFHFKLEEFDSIDIDIDLDSMAWDSFFADGFAEKVSEKFEKKMTKNVKRQIPSIMYKYESSITSFQKNLEKDAQEFATKLDFKLSRTTEKIQKPLLTLLLKSIKGTLDDEDNKYIKKMLEV